MPDFDQAVGTQDRNLPAIPRPCGIEDCALIPEHTRGLVFFTKDRDTLSRDDDAGSNDMGRLGNARNGRGKWVDRADSQLLIEHPQDSSLASDGQKRTSSRPGDTQQRDARHLLSLKQFASADFPDEDPTGRRHGCQAGA